MFSEALVRAWFSVSLDESRAVHTKTYNVFSGFLGYSQYLKHLFSLLGNRFQLTVLCNF